MARKQKASFFIRGFLTARRNLMSGSWMEKVHATVRVAVYAFCAFTILGIFALRSAAGDMSEQALVVGRQLTQLEDFTARSSRMSLNGQFMNIASAVVDEPFEQVLERVATVCRDGSVIGKDLIKNRKPVSESDRLTAWGRLGILSEIRDTEGFVACIAKRPGKEEQSLLEGMQKFSKTRDFGDVGLVRYAYARRTKSGRTHVLTTWTDGSFLVDALMAPQTGDAPGSDPGEGLRPKASRRFLTAQIQGEPDSVHVYQSTEKAEAVLANYDKTLPTKGWESVKELEKEVPEMRHYSRKGVELMVVAAQNGDQAAVTVIQTRSQ